MDGVIICSGGMDSVTLAYMQHSVNDKIMLVSFDYGQRHSKELNFAHYTADNLGVPWEYVNLSHLGRLLGGSALTDRRIDVPEGHYAADSMKQTVVPNRNMIMLSIAVGIAVAAGASYVATAIHAGDHAIYPDCRPDFLASINRTVMYATDGFAVQGFQVCAPFVDMTKAQICELGSTLEVPFDHTWSCYKGLQKHCGKCGTCVERKEAFELAGVTDPTEYADA